MLRADHVTAICDVISEVYLVRFDKICADDFLIVADSDERLHIVCKP